MRPIALCLALSVVPAVAGCQGTRRVPAGTGPAPRPVATAPRPAPYAVPASPSAATPSVAPMPMRSGSGVAFDARDLPLEQAKADAARQGKPMAAWFLASWCPHCTDLDRRTIPDRSVGAEMTRFVNVRYDPDTPNGRAAARSLGVDGFPEVVIFDASGKPVARLPGFSEPAMFIGRVKRALP